MAMHRISGKPITKNRPIVGSMVISPDGKSLILQLSYRTAPPASSPDALRPIVTPSPASVFINRSKRAYSKEVNLRLIREDEQSLTHSLQQQLKPLFQPGVNRPVQNPVIPLA